MPKLEEAIKKLENEVIKYRTRQYAQTAHRKSNMVKKPSEKEPGPISPSIKPFYTSEIYKRSTYTRPYLANLAKIGRLALIVGGLIAGVVTGVRSCSKSPSYVSSPTYNEPTTSSSTRNNTTTQYRPGDWFYNSKSGEYMRETSPLSYDTYNEKTGKLTHNIFTSDNNQKSK